MQSSWNDERVELLAKLRADGLSASQIASRLGSVTRNAVISKLHRLGLSGLVTSGRNKSAARKRGATKPRPMYLSSEHRALAQARIEAFRAEPDIFIPPEERRSLLDLEEKSCRWPYGNGTAADPFYFCNGTKAPGLPYCSDHAKRAFDVPQPRRRTQLPAPATVSAEKETAQ